MVEGGKDRVGNNHYLYNLIKKYSTEWLLNEIGGAATADWTNVHLGTTPTGDSDINHNLDITCICGSINILAVSSDGTDANAIIPFNTEKSGAAADYGFGFSYVDADNLRCQTGTGGLIYLDDNGVAQLLTNQAWYYKIVIYKITCKEF